MRRVTIYTDGACCGQNSIESPVSIGGGIVMLCEEFREEFAVPLGFGTSQQAELLAIQVALEMLSERESLDVQIISDSQYACGILSNSNWKPKANRDIIDRTGRLIRECGRFKIEWVKGHAETEENRRADALAAVACGRKRCETIKLFRPAGSGCRTMGASQNAPPTIPT